MNFRQTTSQGKVTNTEREHPAESGVERSLTLLAEGTAVNMLSINPSEYAEFRGKVSQLAPQMREGLPDADKLALVRSVLHEFEHYRNLSEDALRDRLSGWRMLVSKLLVDLLTRTGIDPASTDAQPLVRRVASLLTVEEIQGFVLQLTDFFRLSGVDSKASRAAHLAVVDRTTANDNATGLRGGGTALKHVGKIIDGNGGGYVVLFHLNCLDMIGERFGMDAVQDSLMAVSAFLSHSLRSDDAIYHWTNSSLLAVLQTPVSVPILTAAMRRIVDNNRDITIQVGGRMVMLRVPLEFEITPISRLRTAEDLHKLSAPSANKW